MKQISSQTKKIVITIFSVVVLVLSVIGITYAAFNYSKIGETVNTVSTGNIIMSYNEETNGINIAEAEPMDDSDGKILNGEDATFDFTVTASIGPDTIINYAITAIKEEGTNLNDEYVKVYLTSVNDEIEELAPTRISDLPLSDTVMKTGVPKGQRVLKQGSITKSEITNYRLRMWISSEDDIVRGTEDQTYRLRVNVYGREEGVEDFDIENPNITLDFNGTTEEKIKLTGENIDSVTYESNNDNVEVSKDGTVTAKKFGTSEITVRNGAVEKQVTVKVVKTVTATYTKQGSGVLSIDRESDSCVLEREEDSCSKELPNIVVDTGYTSLGWSTEKTAKEGATGTITFKDNVEYFTISYKDEVSYKVFFNGNGNTISEEEKSCIIEKTYNEESQKTSCEVTTPTIEENPNTPNIIGYSTDASIHEKTIGSQETLTVDASNNGTTYYAQTTTPAKKHTITFNKNGAQSQTDEGNVAQTAETVTRSCTREATFNGVEQAETCSVTSPTIVGTNITPTVTGYSDAAGNHSSGWLHNSPKEISGDATWYAQTTKAAVTKNVTYKTTTGVASIGQESDSCTIAAIYNNNEGNPQATSCTVQAPSITAESGYEVIGWNTSSEETTGIPAEEDLTLTDATTTYYALVNKLGPTPGTNGVTALLDFYTNPESIQDYSESHIKEDSSAKENKMYVFNHTAGDQQSDWNSDELKSYRYIGADPNNYVTFNNETAGWRIIGIETVDDGTGTKEKRIKLIRKDELPVGTDDNYMAWDNKPGGTGSSESSNGGNNWADSRLMYLLNPNHDEEQTGVSGSIYWNRQSGNCPYRKSTSYVSDETIECDFSEIGLLPEARAMIGDAKWYLGGVSSYTSYNNGLVSHWYSYERGTKVYNNNATYWIGKVGLMYPSDFGYATGYSRSSSSRTNTCYSSTLLSTWTSMCANSDWLSPDGFVEWTISTRSSMSGYVFYRRYGGVSSQAALSIEKVRPTIYLKADVLYQSGDGSSSNPFVFTSTASSDQGIEEPSSISITSQKEVLTSPKKVCQEEVNTGTSYNFAINSDNEVKTGSVCTTSNKITICTDYNNDINMNNTKSCMNGNNVTSYTKSSDSCSYVYVCDSNNKCSAKREC